MNRHSTKAIRSRFRRATMTDMKTCFRCFQTKPLSAFYKHAQMRDGRLNKCIECTKADVTQNRLAKLEHYRKYDRNRASRPDRVAARKAYQQTTEGKLAVARAHHKYEVTHAIRRKAQIATGNAIRGGRLVRQPCFICGAKAQAHHPDYDRPLDVTWLCSKHHKAAHRIVAEILYAAGERQTFHF